MALSEKMRNQALVAMVLTVVLYAVLGMFWYMALTDKASSWKVSQKQYRTAREKVARERRLISQRLMWNDAYDEEREKMPTFPEGEAVDTHWLAKMDSLAVDNHVAIANRQPGQEREVGDVYELPVEVKNWEGGLEPFVKFLYALEHAEEAMFDIQALLIRPSSHKGFLKGQFTLTCAYMRGDDEAAAPAAAKNVKKEKAK